MKRNSKKSKTKPKHKNCVGFFFFIWNEMKINRDLLELQLGFRNFFSFPFFIDFYIESRIHMTPCCVQKLRSKKHFKAKKCEIYVKKIFFLCLSFKMTSKGKLRWRKSINDWITFTHKFPSIVHLKVIESVIYLFMGSNVQIDKRRLTELMAKMTKGRS